MNNENSRSSISSIYLLNFHSSKKTFLTKNSINNRVSQIHLLLYEQSDNDMFERKNCAKTNKQIAHNDI